MLNVGKRLLHCEPWAVDSIRCEELRVICGTRGVPGTVAPFRAWRGSRDLVAQSPKLHASAVADFTTAEGQFNTTKRSALRNG